MTSFYDILDIPRNAKDTDIRKSFMRLALTKHPDKGGNEIEFQRIQIAYETLLNNHKRRIYDAYGEKGLEKTSEQIFTEKFKNGAFANQENIHNKFNALKTENEKLLRNMQIIKPDYKSDFATSFDSWMRNRNKDQGVVITEKDIAEQVGVDPSSYDKVDISEHCGTYDSIERDFEGNLELKSRIIPSELIWNELLVKTLATPLSECDFYHQGKLGADFVGKIIKVGPGVEGFSEGDFVFSHAPIGDIGMFCEFSVIKAKYLTLLPMTSLSMEKLGCFKAFYTAYRILNDAENLKPGDVIIQNNAESILGQAICCLGKILQLKVIALVENLTNELSTKLVALGATLVWENNTEVLDKIEKERINSPRLAIDGLGSLDILGKSLRTGCDLITYSRNPTKKFPNQALIQNMINIKGFYHLFDNKELEDPQMMEAIVLLMEEYKEDFLLDIKKSLNDLLIDTATPRNNKMWIPNNGETELA